MTSIHRFFAAIPLVSTAIAGCSSKVFDAADTATESCLVSDVTVSPPSITMMVGEHLRLSALTRGCPGPVHPAGVRWVSSDTLVVTVDSTGTITSHKVGSASIIAKLNADPTVQGAAVVTVASF